MKTFKITSLLIVFILSLSLHSFGFKLPVKAEEKNPLKIEKIIGLSEGIGTFRTISSNGWEILPRFQQGLVVSSDGTIFIGDDGQGQIEVFGADLQPKFHFGSLGSGDGQFQRLVALMIDNQDRIYAVDSYLARIQVFSKEGAFIKIFGTKGTNPNQFQKPTDIALLSSGELMIVDMINGVKIYSRDGVYIRDFSSHEYLKPKGSLLVFENFPCRVEISQNGAIYFSMYGYIGSAGDNFIAAFDKEGNYIETVLNHDITKELFFGYVSDIEIEGEYFYLASIGMGYPACINRYKIPSDTKETFEFIDKIADAPQKLEELGKTGLRFPTAIFIKNGKTYYLDGMINRLVILDEKLEYTGSIQSTIMAFPRLYQVMKNEEIPLGILENPQGIAVDSKGKIYIGNSDYQCVSVFDLTGKPTTNFGSPFKIPDKIPENPKDIKIDPGDLYSPTGICLDFHNNVFVSDPNLNIIQVFDSNFTPRNTITNNQFMSPQGITFDLERNLLVTNTWKDTIRVLKKRGTEIGEYILDHTINLNGSYPSGIDITTNNEIVVALSDSNQIQVINMSGEITKKIGDLGSNPGQFLGPQGIFVDSADNIYVVETENGRIQKFSPNGSLIWCQNLNWYGLTYIAQDKQGKLYVTDCIHGIVLVLSDATASAPIDQDPTPPPESDASFSFSIDKEKVTEQDEFTLFVNVDKLEHTASIDLTIQYPKELLSFESCETSDLLKDQSFEVPAIEQSIGFANIKSKSSDGKEASGSGTLFEIEWKTKRHGLAYLEFADITLKNSEDKSVSYANKKGLSLIIQPRDTSPPPLTIKPIPSVVYDPFLLIEGETEPGASVTINQKEIAVSEEGKFSTKIELIKGDNTILVETTDKAGNKSKQTILVTLKDRIIIELVVGNKVMTVNGTSSQLDSEPFIDPVSGRTMVPIRAVSEAIGAEVEFDPKDQRIMISLRPIILVLWIGKPIALIDGVEILIDPSGKVAPVIVKGRTFLPLRFIAETFGFKVDWDPKTQGITLTFPDPDKK